MIKVIGVDPGLADTGIGIVQGCGLTVNSYAYGSISTAKTEIMACRLESIYNRIRQVLDEESPDLMVVEDVFSLEKFPKSGIVLGKVCGVILLAGIQAGVELAEVPVRQAKQILTGNGNASKAQLERAVRHTLGMAVPIRPFHASDALGLALIGLFRYHAR
ncbi:crossover junction endodeoxyribonuclease RuvC [Desulfosarcina ovata subsp. sediminis]|uniref:Crossover junction endodeoxyribonuclease RuvC n=1 Tax=Desulfosarcina ovata subsp. sediminis TaxID=885957 RepID=A0A5K7ZRH6_9BACT|nr:crossover junction endodeoxyribonuclease RuvC [Desulfosarcina ovata]BBO81653.1 crossover junction endodeoxyribonuclease RuvC [Desulfosarcina ovata subsp. sediminis]